MTPHSWVASVTAVVWIASAAFVVWRGRSRGVGSAIAGLVPLDVLVRRRRGVDATTRATSQWIASGAIAVASVGGVGWALHQLTGWPSDAMVVLVAASTLVPLARVASELTQESGGASEVLVHTIVASGLVLLATTIYLVIVIGFDGTPSPEQRPALGLALVATALIAVLALPARRSLERFAMRHVYGERESPERALTTFAGRMTRAVPLDELLLQLAESLRRVLPATRVEVWSGSDGSYNLAVAVPDRSADTLLLGVDERSVATRTPVAGSAWLQVWVPALCDGRRDAFLRVAPIAHLGDLFGFLIVERGETSADFDDDADRVLTDIARQVGLALHNARLDSALQASLDQLKVRNDELVASRARIVAASDESRRRIERNLHDGAQQHLVAMAVKLGVTRQLLDDEPSLLPNLLDELREDVQATLTELRELAHGIYPPLLRSRGLSEALTAAANRAVLPTTVCAAGLPRFDAEVEAAVYFCCLEAIQNAGKHAGADATSAVSVDWTDQVLSFTVSDNGDGFDAGQVAGGDGFVNMADRLGAIGGVLTVTSAPGEGTSVAGRIPQVAESS